MNKLVVILGATSSGKSGLAIKLARQFNGEIVSADSRQVYKNLNIGTGKVTKREQKSVPHHLLDVVSPRSQFTVSQYRQLALKAIGKIHKQRKLPFLVGGTAFYIYAVVDNLVFPEVKPNSALRKALDKLSTEELFKRLKQQDPARAKTIDPHNRPRLIRALEILQATGSKIPPAAFTYPNHHGRILILGVKRSLDELFRLVDDRLARRVKSGLIKEVKNLLAAGLSHRRLEELGLEYRYVSKYLKKEISRTQMLEELTKANHAFAKRQITWFKRDPRIQWIKNEKEASTQVKKFLKRP